MKSGKHGVVFLVQNYSPLTLGTEQQKLRGRVTARGSSRRLQGGAKLPVIATLFLQEGEGTDAFQQ